jgi:glycosyltransferase involved in cell wall biosynthesis
MQIGIDARLMHHQPAGISRYTWHLLHALARLNTEDDFTVFQHRKHRERIIDRANFKRATLFAPVHTRLEQTMLPLELMRYPLDTMHSTDFIPPLYTNIPTIITVHDLAFLHWPHFLTESSAAYYGQIDRAVRRAQHIIVPSDSTRQDLMRQLGVAPGKVSVIYEAADPRFKPLPIDQARHAVQQKFGIPDNYIFFVSTIEPRKNVTGLLQAYRHLRDAYNLSDTALVIAGGKGWLYEEVLEAVEELGLEDSTFFLGRVSDDDLQELYVAARCHVHPAHYEGFGLPPLEAMACGTPTVVSNVSSLPEVVNDAALLVNPEDWEEIAVAIHRLLTDADLHAELRNKGLRRADCFSWDKAAQQTMDVYRQVVGLEAVDAVDEPVSSHQTMGS